MTFDQIAIAALNGVMSRPNSEGVHEKHIVREVLRISEAMQEALAERDTATRKAARIAEEKRITDAVAAVVAKNAVMKSTDEEVPMETVAAFTDGVDAVAAKYQDAVEGVAEEVTELEKTEQGAEGRYEAQMSDPSTTPDPTAGAVNLADPAWPGHLTKPERSISDAIGAGVTGESLKGRMESTDATDSRDDSSDE